MNFNKNNLKIIAFDADDTLWVNETYFREAEQQFAQLLSVYETPNKIDQELFKIEIDNLPTYGYGIKAFMLSMIEAALSISNNNISNEVIEKVLAIGKAMLNKPIELLDGVETVLKTLAPKYKLIVLTKGDLLDQERKLTKSGLLQYFDYIEVMSEKKEANYQKILQHLNVKPNEFLMIGNSLKSDVLPLVNIGANAIHIPFHTTWAHEQVPIEATKNKNYTTLTSIKELLSLL